MTYALAKDLKEAGFPQGVEIEMFCSECKTENPMCEHLSDKLEWLRVPTLSELIDACGQDNFILGRNQSEWSAQVHNKNSRTYTQNYPTPEEAVTRLWLALNKKV